VCVCVCLVVVVVVVVVVVCVWYTDRDRQTSLLDKCPRPLEDIQGLSMSVYVCVFVVQFVLEIVGRSKFLHPETSL